MKILIALRLTPAEEERLLADNTCYRPDLSTKSEWCLASALRSAAPDAVIVGDLPSRDVLEEWHSTPEKKRYLVTLSGAEGEARTPDIDLPNWLCHENLPGLSVERALSHLEDRCADVETVPAQNWSKKNLSSGSNSVVMVGAGIVNLITALELVDHTEDLLIVDKGFDPRQTSAWASHDGTFSGQNGRIFSFMEARQHHYRDGRVDADFRSDFRRPVEEGGWLSLANDKLTRDDIEWIRKFESLPAWLAGKYDSDIVAVNKAGFSRWGDLMERYGHLFADVKYQPQLLRVYATDAQWRHAVERETAIGSILETLPPDAVASRYPVLAPAVEQGAIAGGLLAKGFGLGIHSFGCRLLDHLEKLGVEFRWTTDVTQVVRRPDNRVVGLRDSSDNIITADNYVISPGYRGASSIQGLPDGVDIAGVIGLWLSFETSEPVLEPCIKYSRSGFASPGASEGANIFCAPLSVGRSVIHVSSGHGFIGTGKDARRWAETSGLETALRDTARKLFPHIYDPSVPDEIRSCVRPWTPSGLGVFAREEVVGGGQLIFTGGHTTGGFAQAPAVAGSVSDCLLGEKCEMERILAPRRMSSFLSQQ